MTDEMRAAWIEACAKAIFGDACRDSYAIEKATAALSVLTPLIAEACAKIADDIEEDAKRGAFELYGPGSPGFARRMDKAQAARDISAAIRNAFPAKGESPPPTPGEG